MFLAPPPLLNFVSNLYFKMSGYLQQPWNLDIDCWTLGSFLGCDTVSLGLWLQTVRIVQCLLPEGSKGPRRIIFLGLLDHWRWRRSSLETWWPTIPVTAVKPPNLALCWLLFNLVPTNWFYSPLSSSCISCFLLWFYHHRVYVCVLLICYI